LTKTIYWTLMPADSCSRRRRGYKGAVSWRGASP